MQNIMNIVFFGIIACCIVTILVGILGILTGKYKTCCTIGLFSFCSFFMSIVFLAVGCLILLVTIASAKYMEVECLNDQDEFSINFNRYFLNYMVEYQKATEELPNTYMCSFYCPCFPFNNQAL